MKIMKGKDSLKYFGYFNSGCQQIQDASMVEWSNAAHIGTRTAVRRHTIE